VEVTLHVFCTSSTHWSKRSGLCDSIFISKQGIPGTHGIGRVTDFIPWCWQPVASPVSRGHHFNKTPALLTTPAIGTVSCSQLTVLQARTDAAAGEDRALRSSIGAPQFLQINIQVAKTRITDFLLSLIACLGAGIAQSVQQLTAGWTAKRLEFDSGWGKKYSPFRVFKTDSGTHSASYPTETEGSFPGVKRSEREAVNSTTSAGVKNTWFYTSTLPHVFMA
jgi:hypothetical protein